MSDLSIRMSSYSSTIIPSIKPHKISHPFYKALPCCKFQSQFNLNLRKFNGKPNFSAVSSMAEIGSSSESSVVAKKSENGTPCAPLYVPTPSHRELRTPHSGYHFDGSTRQFFEGWYFKVSIPEKRQSFCFMYSVENPAFRKKLTSVEEAKYGRRFTGVGAQILGADDKYICQFTDESQNFWGSRHELMLGNTFKSSGNSQPPTKEVPPEEFNRRVSEGFQVTPLWHQGFICDDGRSDYVETVKTARWEYCTRPVYGWGNVSSKQRSTAGWLAAFPVFEPHWQICMAGGLSTGWIEWDGERFEFENAPSYSEKNWGAGFPKKWFWILKFKGLLVGKVAYNLPFQATLSESHIGESTLVQCNVFEGTTGEVALTAAGGLRELPGGRIENAALVGVHHAGIFYEFVPWNGSVEWDIAPWGCWKISADNGSYKVELEATTEDPGTPLRAPTSDNGLAVACKDTCFGLLKMRLWERKSDGSNGKVILEVTSNMAALEVGGGPWFKAWKGTTTTPEILSAALKVPLDMESVYNFVPFLKPPGL